MFINLISHKKSVKNSTEFNDDKIVEKAPNFQYMKCLFYELNKKKQKNASQILDSRVVNIYMSMHKQVHQ